MFKSFNENAAKRTAYSILCACMALLSTSFASCVSDEPDSGKDNESAQGIVTANELVWVWTLVRNNVLYSQVDPGKSDEVISYSGNTSPRYRFYNVTISEDGVLTMVEESVSGSIVSAPIHLTLNGNDLIATDGKVAGTIEHYDASHSWDNLRIKWNAEYSPIRFGAPVVSTYMRANYR